MTEEKKNWLVDVPVQINLWIRPELQRRQFEVIKQVRPSIIFAISDGGRNEKEWESIRQNRQMYDTEIDWHCTVYKLYADHNMGMYTTVDEMYNLVFSKVDRCIFLEDDMLPSPSFFTFCAEMLERYKDDERIYAVCGMNHLGTYEECSSDYFFSRYGSIWGFAFWKRSWESYHHDEFARDPYTMRLLKDRTKDRHTHWTQIQSVAENGILDGHIPSDEFYMNLAIYGYSQMFIIPKYNLIRNMGCDENAAHSDSADRLPKAIRALFNMKTYEMNFPLKHPRYIIPDISYEKKRNRIMALDHPFIQTGRNIQRVFLIAKSGDFKYLKDKISGALIKKRINET